MTRDILVDPPLPHVSFGDTFADRPPPESVTYYLNGPFWDLPM